MPKLSAYTHRPYGSWTQHHADQSRYWYLAVRIAVALACLYLRLQLPLHLLGLALVVVLVVAVALALALALALAHALALALALACRIPAPPGIQGGTGILDGSWCQRRHVDRPCPLSEVRLPRAAPFLRKTYLVAPFLRWVIPLPEIKP